MTDFYEWLMGKHGLRPPLDVYFFPMLFLLGLAIGPMVTGTLTLFNWLFHK